MNGTRHIPCHVLGLDLDSGVRGGISETLDKKERRLLFLGSSRLMLFHPDLAVRRSRFGARLCLRVFDFRGTLLSDGESQR